MDMRLYVKLDLEEYRALAEMAKADLREAREQLRYLVREEAKRRGILAAIPVVRQRERGSAVCAN